MIPVCCSRVGYSVYSSLGSVEFPLCIQTAVWISNKAGWMSYSCIPPPPQGTLFCPYNVRPANNARDLYLVKAYHRAMACVLARSMRCEKRSSPRNTSNLCDSKNELALLIAYTLKFLSQRSYASLFNRQSTCFCMLCICNSAHVQILFSWS